MIYFIIAIVIMNVIIGFIITIMSGSKYPYKSKNRTINSNFNSFENIDIEEVKLNQDSEVEDEVVLIENDQVKVNKLAHELIPKNEDHKDPKQDAADEMGEKVKGYFDSNPNEAAKIFKSMLKNK